MSASPGRKSGTWLVDGRSFRHLPLTHSEAVFSRASVCLLFPVSFLLSSSALVWGQEAHKTHKGLRKFHWCLNNVYYLRTPSRTAVSILAKFAESHFSGKKLDFQHLKNILNSGHFSMSLSSAPTIGTTSLIVSLALLESKPPGGYE